MTSEFQTKRIPKQGYAGKNGFLRPPTEVAQNIPDAVDRHRLATFIIENKKRSVPNFEQMKAEVALPDDAAILQERVKRLVEDHHEDLNKLYDCHATEYVNEIVDRNASKPGISEDPELESRLKHLYTSGFRDAPTQLDWTNGYEILRYTFLSQFLALKTQQLELEQQEELARKQREQLFPQSKEDFHNKPHDVQMRAARFLVADKIKQERLISQYQWAWRQVKPLQDIFVKDEEFSAEIRSIIITSSMS
ncbi:hypothetical protein CPB83DRAFT_885221 [Crepidotus variabilis]|uniref:Uncharacterized protein n=1 Tax=Crepidotus variabilis TaxID=179855 RepID=A0A9P6EAS0_9AGAR|nr:hypothetical protein CPB83DRAFT_885221 [Crepidotus variabilis]